MTTPFKTKKAPAFEYPKLKDAEIINCCQQLGIEVEPDGIKNITPEGMRFLSDNLIAFMVCVVLLCCCVLLLRLPARCVSFLACGVVLTCNGRFCGGTRNRWVNRVRRYELNHHSSLRWSL